METGSFGNGWEGRVVEGRFPLLERLGGSENCGSFLTVLQGLKEAVIQLISPRGDEAETYLAQWDFAKGLSHPHLAKLFEQGRCVIDRNDLVYVVSERPYATLSKITQTRALKADSARETFDPILNALAYLHQNGVVHGHVRPWNIQFADMKPKLPVTDLLIAGSIKRSIQAPGPYDAPELAYGAATEAADTWSIGMTLWEAMTQALPTWDPSRSKEPEVSDSLPGPFREIVQDCLRVDPLRRSTIEDILKRLDESKSIPVADTPAPVKKETLLEPAASIPPGETPIPDKPVPPPSPAKKITVEDSSEPPLFSRSLTHFEDKPQNRFRVLPYAIVLLAIVAVISVLLIRGHKGEAPPPVANPNVPASNPSAPEKQAPPPAPSAPTQAEPGPSAGVSQPQPEAAPQAQTPAAPIPEKPVPPATSAPDHAAAKETSDGLVVKRVLPTVSSGARAGLRRPVEVLIRVTVNKEGTVSSASYLSQGPGNYFARLAQRAARSWKFKPPKRNGEAQRSVWTLRFNFEREKTDATATEERG